MHKTFESSGHKTYVLLLWDGLTFVCLLNTFFPQSGLFWLLLGAALGQPHPWLSHTARFSVDTAKKWMQSQTVQSAFLLQVALINPLRKTIIEKHMNLKNIQIFTFTVLRFATELG